MIAILHPLWFVIIGGLHCCGSNIGGGYEIDGGNYCTYNHVGAALVCFIESEIWYYPVPLADVKGLTLDIKSNARSTVTLQVKRPWWAAVIMAVGTSGVIWATFHAYFYPIYMEYLNPNARAHEYDPGGADLSIYILVCVIGFWIWAAGMAFFLFKKRLWHSKKKPWQLQERQIRLGILDPITRATSVFYCNMEDDYSLTSAQTFIRHLQQHAPQLHFGSLASTHVSAQLRQQDCHCALLLNLGRTTDCRMRGSSCRYPAARGCGAQPPILKSSWTSN